jgi:hypothetical protein
MTAGSQPNDMHPLSNRGEGAIGLNDCTIAAGRGRCLPSSSIVITVECLERTLPRLSYRHAHGLSLRINQACLCLGRRHLLPENMDDKADEQTSQKDGKRRAMQMFGGSTMEARVRVCALAYLVKRQWALRYLGSQPKSPTIYLRDARCEISSK